MPNNSTFPKALGLRAKGRTDATEILYRGEEGVKDDEGGKGEESAWQWIILALQ
jgi:hypothetical protein